MANEAQTGGSISFEEGWPGLQEGFNQLIDIVEGVPHRNFTSQQYMNYYTIAYNICGKNPFNPDAQKLYDQFQKTFEEYLSSKVLPVLREKKDENLLQELIRRWSSHKLMTRWFAKFLYSLNRHFVLIRKVPTLQVVSYLTFYNVVCREINDQVRDVVISVIDEARKGEQIDQALVKNVLDIYVDIGEGSMKYFEEDFEEGLLNKTTSFYSHKASIWIEGESYNSYMFKVDECLKKEQDMLSSCLPDGSRKKLLKVVEHQLLSVYASQLGQKKQLN